MAAYAYHANVLNYEDAEVNRFFCEALFKIGYEESVDTLLPTVLKVGEINLKCMALLDKANTKTYGTPEPTAVTLTVEKGPFICSFYLNRQKEKESTSIPTVKCSLPMPIHS